MFADEAQRSDLCSLTYWIVGGSAIRGFMAESQRELLDRLRINRDEEDEDTGGGKRWLIVGFVTFCALVAAIAIYSFWPSAEAPQTAATSRRKASTSA